MFTTVIADYDRHHKTCFTNENARNIFDVIILFLTLRQVTEI